MTNEEHIEIILSYVNSINKGNLHSYEESMELELIGEDFYTYTFDGYTQTNIGYWGEEDECVRSDSQSLNIDSVKVMTPETASDGEFIKINFTDKQLELLTNQIGYKYNYYEY